MLRSFIFLFLAMVTVVGLAGCSASPPPLLILMPTYAFDRDGFGDASDTMPLRFDPVVTAEP